MPGGEVMTHMTHMLTIGISFGGIVGLVHAVYVYFQQTTVSRKRLAEHPVAVRARAAYFALWTVFLWMVFGGYVFSLWVISAVLYALTRVLKRVVACGWRFNGL